MVDPERLITTNEKGVGKARAFGCGLLLLRRI
ncbi:type I-E CRISPR-associated protein Cas6/Cse3/CasE [Acerihabitans sp. TG2]